MRTVTTIDAAERFLRKLAGTPSTVNIRTVHHTTVLQSGRVLQISSTRITIDTEERLEIDSQQRPTLQEAFDVVCQAITTERARIASKRNTDAIKKLALHRPEVPQ